MQVSEMAALMGATESDVQGFVDCLRVWTDKGYTLEQAIERNSAAWQTLLTNVYAGQQHELSRHRAGVQALVAVAVDAFYPQQVAA